MLVEIKYTIQRDGVEKTMDDTFIYGDGESLVNAAIQLAGALHIVFSSLEDIDHAIIKLQKLRKRVVQHMNIVKNQFIPYTYQNDDEASIDITTYYPDEIKISVRRTENKLFETISISEGEGKDLAHQTINILVPKGKAESIGERIVSAAKNQKEEG